MDRYEKLADEVDVERDQRSLGGEGTQINEFADLRYYNCIEYLNCLQEAAIRNHRYLLCRRCERYRPTATSGSHLDHLTFSSRHDYIQFDLC